jgi:two-component system chemotaxis response regulator CheY
MTMVTCLVVDESAIFRRISAVMLARLGIGTAEADSVASALLKCAESLPDLALIDWTLPDADGIALVSQMRRLPGGERVKLILCTVERSVTQIETALAAGADEYITKPFGLEVLETKLGYLGFDIAPEPIGADGPGGDSLWVRRHFSRVGYAGMAVAEREEANFRAGEAIFHEGDAPDFAYILLSGRVVLTAMPREADPASLALAPFDLFGELALIENTPRAWGAVALTDCTMMRLSRQRFQLELGALTPFMRNWVESLTDQTARLFVAPTDRIQRKAGETE